MPSLPASSSAERYRPLRPLGSGGSGSVWLARDERTGLEVALKIVPREGKAATRAEREALAAARLRHERCLRAYGLDRDSRNVYIAYEYVPGQTLREALRAGELDDAAAVEAAAQILEGLAHAHARGIVHRDVKPSNVLLADGEGISVRLLDFGLAQLAEEETLTAAGDVPGTLAYVLARAAAHGESGGPPADVWAVGVMLWESLAGWHPFWNGSLLETAKRIEAGAAPLAQARPDLPKPLCALVDRHARARPGGAAAGGAARRTSSATPPPSGRRRRTTRTTVRRARAAAAPRARRPPRRCSPAGRPPRCRSTRAARPLARRGLPGGSRSLRERLGLAFALAVPVLPLGNVSLGLALVYAALALVAGALWGDAARGLLIAVGPLLSPLARARAAAARGAGDATRRRAPSVAAAS